MEFDSDTKEFLDALGNSTRKIYSAGLAAFQTFYGKPINTFLDSVEEDLRRPRRQRTRVARNILKQFVEYLEKQGYAPKTVRSYVGAVQSLAHYYEIPISTRYVHLPPSNPVSKKFPWTIERVVEFIELIKDLELKSLAVTLFQSGLSVSDALSLTFGDIKYEFERGVTPLCFDLARIKTDNPFMTFIGKWGFNLLSNHLQGEKLTLNTPLYTISHRTVDYHFQKLAENFVGEYQGRNPIRPHSLRAAFRTLLGDAGCDRDVVKFWMGQRLPEQDRVYHSRSRDGWRKLYSAYEHALTPESWSEWKQ